MPGVPHELGPGTRLTRLESVLANYTSADSADSRVCRRRRAVTTDIACPGQGCSNGVSCVDRAWNLKKVLSKQQVSGHNLELVRSFRQPCPIYENRLKYYA